MMVKILSWNVNGLNSPRKRKIVFHWIKKQKCDVVCLQEMQMRKKDSKLLVNNKLGDEFYSLSQKKKKKKSKGVIFYVNKDLNPKVVFSDKEGRYLALEVDYEGGKHL